MLNNEKQDYQEILPYLDFSDFYEFDEKNYRLIGSKLHRIYALGDAITIRVARANLEKKQLDFVLAE